MTEISKTWVKKSTSKNVSSFIKTKVPALFKLGTHSITKTTQFCEIAVEVKSPCCDINVFESKIHGHQVKKL